MENIAVFEGYTLNKRYDVIRKEIEEFEVYDDDIWITSFPKSGTTWTQEILWCLANNFDFEGAKAPLEDRFPFLEVYIVMDDIPGVRDENNKFPNSVKKAREAKRPRLIKTHLPWELLPKQIRDFEKRPKIVHIARNPKDVCVSFFHHHRLFRESNIDNLESFGQAFINAEITWTPSIRNVLSYWNKRNEPNILFLKYEDLKTDIIKQVKKIANFLGVTYTETQLKQLLEHISFESMKKNKSINLEEYIAELNGKEEYNPEFGSFIRKGIVGSYKNEMSEELIKKFDEYIKKETEGTDLTF